MKTLRDIIQSAVKDFFSDGALTWAAAIAFYSALSMGPLLMLLLWVTSLLGNDTQAGLVDQLSQLMGDAVAPAIEQIIANAETTPGRGLAAVVSLGVLLFSASGVFAQLQAALNAVFDVKAKPAGSATATLWAFVRKRLLSFGMVGAVLFLLLVSLAASTVATHAARVLGAEGWLGPVVSVGITLLVFAGLFAVMFKLLPDVRVGWRNALVGAAVTAVLFAGGKLLIGLYLGHSSVGSSYGAAGSLIVLLVWVYYSAVIVMLGAEMTQAIALRSGQAVQPDEHAVWADADAGTDSDAAAPERERAGRRRPAT